MVPYKLFKLRFLLSSFFFGCLVSYSFAQSQKTSICLNPNFDQKIANTISHTIPVISPNQLKELTSPVILDTRELEEYKISHIEGAFPAGYEDFDLDQFLYLPKDTTIVVYCSIGYRSEKIGERLKKKGFTNVLNLYGSIFEWANQENPLVDSLGNLTNNIHTYNKAWSKWVDEKKVRKIW